MSKTKQGLINFAKSKIGTPYIYGAKGAVMSLTQIRQLRNMYGTSCVWNSDDSKAGKVCVDCSGLISWYTGILRGSQNYYDTAIQRLPISQRNNSHIGWAVWMKGHIGIYLGNNQYIAADGSAYGVRIANLSQNRFTHLLKLCDIDYTDIPKNSDPDGELRSGGIFQSKTDHLGHVSYQAHMRGIGWGNWQSDGNMIGSTDQNRRIEAIKIQPHGKTDVTIHIKSDGDKTYKNITKDTIIGTTNQKKRIEAIKIDSTETIYRYRVHQKRIGWSSWKTNGEWAGEKGKSLQIEAIEIRVVKFFVNAHMQSEGWLGWKPDGEIAGLTGKKLRLEALKIDPLKEQITVQAHIQGKGWVDYGQITKETVIGSVSESRRLECIKFKGDFEYRVHIQGSGWTNWTKADGIATLGTVGQALRIEAIDFRTM